MEQALWKCSVVDWIGLDSIELLEVCLDLKVL